MTNEAKPSQRAREADYLIQERKDDMLICARDYRFGWRCIARRPKLLKNDEWRPQAEEIVAALATLPTAPAREVGEDDVERVARIKAARHAMIATAFLSDNNRERLDLITAAALFASRCIPHPSEREVELRAYERAAKVAENYTRHGRDWVPDSLWGNITKGIAAAIRALGAEEREAG